jgi:phosphate butyryltransferase
MISTFGEIIETAKKNGKKRLAVTWAKRQDVNFAVRAAKEGLIIPVLIGEDMAIKSLVERTPLASLEHEIVAAKDPAAAIQKAIMMVREGRADILVQGAVDQKAFMGAITGAKTGLLKSKVASYASVFQLLRSDKLVIATDTYINNSPAVAEKQVILENALQLARALGIEAPKVAVLAAVEQVNPSIPSTLDAAALAKMSERKQFGNVIVEGPLDMDCALSQTAAARKGLSSVVTGNVDIYLVPEVETGSLLVQALVFFGKMQTAGVVMGTAKPVILNLPFVSDENRIVEIALAGLISRQGGING